jgi:hypothetical protein
LEVCTRRSIYRQEENIMVKSCLVVRAEVTEPVPIGILAPPRNPRDRPGNGGVTSNCCFTLELP